MPSVGEEDGSCFYENVGFEGRPIGGQEPDIEAHIVEQEVYDLPRPRATDNVYINENFDDDPTMYDTPRRKGQEYEEEDEDEEMELMECEYDIPKVREATLTPIEEEESQEYDVPRATKAIRRPLESSEENLYENQLFNSSRPTLEEPIYMNELSDDRSSGYRSSSSPSIHRYKYKHNNYKYNCFFTAKRTCTRTGRRRSVWRNSV